MSPYLNSTLTLAGINILLAYSFYLPRGVGLLALGQGAFMGIGAYTSAILTVKYGIGFYPSLLAGGITATVVGILTGFAALRLKGLYLAILTMAFGEIVRVIFINTEWLGGVEGIFGIPPHTNLAAIVVAIVILMIFFQRTQHSRPGRTHKAIRDNEDVAEAFGVNIFREKVTAYGMGAFIGGVAGGFYAHYILYIEPAAFNFERMVEILMFCVFGGVQSYWGPFLGALVLTLIPEAFRFLSDWRVVFYGLVLIITMVLRPQGIIDRELIRRIQDFCTVSRHRASSAGGD
jgi:branched-chain amino acid transport system permease protein